MNENQERPHMRVIRLDDIKPVEHAGGLWWDLVVPKIASSEHLAICLAKYEPNVWLYRHYHTAEECYFVLQGKLLVELDGELKDAPEMTAVYIPSGVKHRFKCCGNDPATVLVMIADKDWIYEGPHTNSFKSTQ